MKLLFVCVGNSCRSQMAEGLAKAMGFEADSAGTHPAGDVAAHALELLQSRNIQTEGMTPKSVDNFNAEDYDILFVVQPSSLQELQLSQLIDAINKGIPTAIFEDPIPQTVSAPPTRQPLRGRVASFQFGDPPVTPKADIRRLWAAIGIEAPYSIVEEDPGIGQGNPQNLQLVSPDVVWQDANPYPTLDLSEIDSLFYSHYLTSLAYNKTVV